MTQDSLQLQNCIVREVKKYPCLYDPNHLGQWNARRREPYWQAIAEAVNAAAPPSPPRPKSRFFKAGVTAMDCQRIWRLLRCRYVREVRLGARRAPDGTLLRAHSQWALFRRLDFLRDHIRPKTHQLEPEWPDANVVDYVESTDASGPTFVRDDAGAVQRQGEVVSPVDLEFDVLPGSSDVDDLATGCCDEGAGAAVSSTTTQPMVAATNEDTEAGQGWQQWPSEAVPPVVPLAPGGWQQWPSEAVPPVVPLAPTVMPRWTPPDNKTEQNNPSRDAHERRPGRRRQREGEAIQSSCAEDDRGEEKEAKKNCDLESALCRFLTATVRKVASWTPGSAPAAGRKGRPEIRVNADDADTLFLLALRGLMGTLDAERKSRAQLDILRVLHERVAEAAPESDDGAERSSVESSAAGAIKTGISEVTT